MGGSACFWALGVVRLYVEEADKLYYPLIKCHKAFNRGSIRYYSKTSKAESVCAGGREKLLDFVK